jgi:peptide/nickel transport system substrate-binding protein
MAELNRVSRREFLRVLGTTAAGAAIAACQPQTVIVKETVEVEKEVTKVVEKEVEKVVKETVEVEKEVTKVVEKEVEKVVKETVEVSAASLRQAPMLKELVEAGDLPTLDERVPVDLMILVRGGIDQEIGTYGGDIVVSNAASHQAHEYVLMLSHDITETIPNIAASWKYSMDGESFTLNLRRGIKWSDGAPMTADDIVFWWEALVLNDELTPVKPASWQPGGELMELKKVDDHTIQVDFAAPFWSMHHKIDSTAFAGRQCGGAGGGFYLPSHYLQEYHIDYNPDAGKLAQDADYENWFEYFAYLANTWIIPPGVPVLSSWNIVEEAATGNSWARNPYYFKVDPEGNQLPYIDNMQQVMWDDREGHLMQLVSGQVHYDGWGIAVGDWPVLKKEEDQGGFDVWMGGDLWMAYSAYWFNETYDLEPELGELFAKKEFRQALSLAIDRNEINESISLGQGKPIQATLWTGSSWYKPEWGEAFADYDPDRANQMLDDLGLTQRDSEGFRLLPSGAPLSVIVECTTAQPHWVPYTELVVSFWQDVGVRSSMKIDEWDLLWTRLGSGEMQVFTWVLDNCHDFVLLAVKSHYTRMSWWGPKWWQWFTTDGEEGVEPPQEVKDLYELCEQVPVTPPVNVGPIMQQIWDDQAENIRAIGTVGYVGKPMVSSKKLGNVDFSAYADNADCGGTRNSWMEMMFWKE